MSRISTDIRAVRIKSWLRSSANALTTASRESPTNMREFAMLCDLCPEFGATVARTAVRRLDQDLTAARSANAENSGNQVFV